MKGSVASGLMAAATVMAAFLLAPSTLHAQRASHSAARAPAMQVRPVTANSPSNARGKRATPTTSSIFSNAFGGENLFGGFQGQSLYTGMDLNALADQNLGVRALIDPVTELRLAAAERFLRSTRGPLVGGYYLLDGGVGYAVPTDQADAPQPSQQPQVIVLQQAPAQQPAAQAEPQGETAASLPDEGQFTLILQGGREIEALAFTRMTDKIVYITPEGNRRTINATDLDSEATIRVNQERGTPLQLPL